MNAGDVFRFNGIADIHVWMIISDPCRDPLKVLIVTFTTWEPHLDQACIVEASEHPFIVQKSVVNYARARIVTDVLLEQLRERWQTSDAQCFALATASQANSRVGDGLVHPFH